MDGSSMRVVRPVSRTLVPAILTLLGRRAWTLPAALDRRLPNLDIEGERLQHQLAQPTPAQESV